jgi:glycolate oxidase
MTQPALKQDLKLGVTVENLEAVKTRLTELLGEEWVSTDPTVLTCYFRDFSHAVGYRPNIIALPSTTEEVSRIIKIAKDYGFPVYVITTGFNHAGMAIPKRGGIMMDLKRMDDLCEVDEESMTLTLSPHVRIAAAYEECNKKFSSKGVKLRPANPITMGSASLLANYVSGGASHIAYKTGNHHENIVSMTWVMPDGEIVKTGSDAYPMMGKIPVLGPGPDMGGLFLACQGSFGICTEITIKLFNEFKYERMIFIALDDFRDYSLDKVSEFFYKVGRMNFVQDFYKSGNKHMACLSEGKVEDFVDTAPAHLIMVSITGNTEEELEIKNDKLMKMIDEIGGLVTMPQEVMEQLISAQNLTMEEFMRTGTKRLHKGGRVMRWKGSFQWLAFPMKFEHLPKFEKKVRDIVMRYWAPTDPKFPFDLIPFGVSLQGPFTLSRFVAFEFDFYVDQGNPEEIRKLRTVFEKIVRMMVAEGCVVGRTAADSQEISMPFLGTYFELLKQVKKTLDPLNVMAPDQLPISEDYI